jgi:Rrf2 family nitric oxide-sensitive transcriptional repressor
MRLTRFTDIGLRALMYAGAREGRTVSAREIAEAFNVSRDHVAKSLQGLVALGALRSVPGRNGGFILDADLREVKLGELVRSMEPHVTMAECFTAESHCPLTPSCELASALYSAQESFFETLDRYTIADLIEGTYQGLVQLTYASPTPSQGYGR